jgi:hypothetical protein
MTMPIRMMTRESSPRRMPKRSTGRVGRNAAGTLLKGPYTSWTTAWTTRKTARVATNRVSVDAPASGRITATYTIKDSRQETATAARTAKGTDSPSSSLRENMV